MKELKITQAELANHLGVSRAAVNDWCKGKKKPSLEKIITIATFLNTSTDYLLRPEVEMISFEEDFMLKHYGLTSKSIGLLKEIKNQKHIIDTLNTVDVINNSYGIKKLDTGKNATFTYNVMGGNRLSDEEWEQIKYNPHIEMEE